MKLTNIEIKNFRGIEHTCVFFPLDSRIVCLIGAGDSGKSTLLTAIEWALWPSWDAESHAWLETEDSLVIDITGDQYAFKKTEVH